MCGAPDQSVALPAGTDLTKETVLAGRVLSGGSPVGGAFVRLLDGTGEFTAEVVASASGDFRFFAAPGTWTVSAPPSVPLNVTHPSRESATLSAQAASRNREAPLVKRTNPNAESSTVYVAGSQGPTMLPSGLSPSLWLTTPVTEATS